MGDDRRETTTGTVLAAAPVYKKTWYGDQYTVWHCQVLPARAGVTCDEVHVGEWYPGAFHKDASITAAGPFHPQGDGGSHTGFIQADSITDDLSHARFTELAAPMDNRSADVTGKVTLLEPIPAPGGAGRIGWAFDVLDDKDQMHTVVMCGSECPDVVVDGNRVHVAAPRDIGGVIHANRIKDLTAPHDVTVEGTRGRESGRGW